VRATTILHSGTLSPACRHSRAIWSNCRRWRSSPTQRASCPITVRWSICCARCAPNLTLVHEPTRTVVGRPDFAILHQHAPVGYVEAEAYAADLDNLPPRAKAQTDAFRQHLENFLLFQSSPARGSRCNVGRLRPPATAAAPVRLCCFNPHPPVGADASSVYPAGYKIPASFGLLRD
jgi:hypothetical protein